MEQVPPYKPKNKIRIVTAASLFDGHDAAINIMRRIIQSTGCEVIHLGHDRSVEEVVNCAIQEDAQAIAMTSYQGGHNEYFKYMFDLLKENGVIQYSLYSYRSSEPNIDGYKSLEEYPIIDNNEQQQMIVKDYFLKSFCSIILESITDNVFITEKLDKCLLAKQPFIIFGGSNYLNHLKEL